MIDLRKIEQKLAVSAARSDVEWCCKRLGKAKDGYWYDTAVVALDDTDIVKEAVKYLEWQNLLVRHPEKPNLVQLLRQNKVEAP